MRWQAWAQSQGQEEEVCGVKWEGPQMPFLSACHCLSPASALPAPSPVTGAEGSPYWDLPMGLSVHHWNARLAPRNCTTENDWRW